MERNLLADISKMVEKNKTCKRKDDLRTIVTDGLLSLGFNASVCKSKWEKTSSIPAGTYLLSPPPLFFSFLGNLKNFINFFCLIGILNFDCSIICVYR